jgi:hypothetical protein
MSEFEKYDNLQDLLTFKFKDIMKDTKAKLLESYKIIKMKIRKRIFKAAADIECEMNDKITALLKNKNMGYEVFRQNTLETIEDLNDVIGLNSNVQGDHSRVYCKLTDMNKNFEEIDREYNKFKDYLEFFKNFQIELKYNEGQLLDCFKVSMKDAGGILKRNLEEHSEILAETISNLSQRDDITKRLDESFALAGINPLTSFKDSDANFDLNTPVSSDSSKNRTNFDSVNQNFFKSPNANNTNFMRSSTNSRFMNSQIKNKSKNLKMSTLETAELNPSPEPILNKTEKNFFDPQSLKDPRGSKNFNDMSPLVATRKPSSNSDLPIGQNFQSYKRSPSMLADPNTEFLKSSRRSHVVPNPRSSASFQSPPEQIANLSNLHIDSTKFRKVILTIISCYKTITRINFRTNVFNCDPVKLLKEIFSKPLFSLFTIDLRKNQIENVSGSLREDINDLLVNNIKVII